MRFSLRSLLAIILLCAIAFPLIIQIGEVRVDEAKRLQMGKEIQILRTQLALDDPARQRVHRHQDDQYASLHQLRDRAEQHFQSLQEKHGRIESRGPDVLSLRSIPQISTDQRQPPIVYRVLVPAQRDVWLKFTVLAGSSASRSSQQLDRPTEPPIDSGFQHVGPYELRLQPGDQRLRIETGPVIENTLPIAVYVNDDLLLSTSFSGDGVPSNGMFRISGTTQIDYGANAQLPWLMNFDVKLQRDNDANRDVAFDGCLWLSDRSSGFHPFPEQAAAK